MRREVLTAALALTLLVLPNADVVGAVDGPSTVRLPAESVFPEGVAVDERTGWFYVTSNHNGSVVRGDVRTGAVRPFLPAGGDGRTSALGAEVDWTGTLWVAGGATEKVFAHDARTGALKAVYTTRAGSLPNDVVVTPGGEVFVTDSFQPVLWRIPAGAASGPAQPWLDLTGSPIRYVPGYNLNGIVLAPDGDSLLVDQTETGDLWRIGLADRRVTRVDLGGFRLPGGDGMVLRDRTLFVAQPLGDLVAEVRLARDGTRGSITGRLADPGVRFPTTVAPAGDRLLVVNSQFDRRNQGLPPDTPFTVSVIALR
ncbi:superoxide dismutase [Saccharothrix sp. 6-C]|uniref:SMP-30/gluconolactonase/LRE family protein n=1 Tax=Saccharothrix sp. 6-C TaxID=2781735 RepID=UPI0019171509|nr:hypothetical protein [Saccharothrix sp. 6-C]QQQ79561.1 superoxide dismutase [Saccharothrix sp. 6-C]